MVWKVRKEEVGWLRCKRGEASVSECWTSWAIQRPRMTRSPGVLVALVRHHGNGGDGLRIRTQMSVWAVSCANSLVACQP